MLIQQELEKNIQHYYGIGEYRSAYTTISCVKSCHISLELIPKKHSSILTIESMVNIASILEIIFQHVDIALLEDNKLHDIWEMTNCDNDKVISENGLVSLLHVKTILGNELLRRKITNEEKYIESNDISESELDMSEMFWQLRRSQKVNSKIYKMFQDKKLPYWKDILKSFNDMCDLLVLEDERELVKSFVTRIDIKELQQADLVDYFMTEFTTQNYKEASNILSYINRETIVNLCVSRFLDYIYKSEYKTCSEENKNFLTPILQTIYSNIDWKIYSNTCIQSCKAFMEFNWERLGKK